MPSIIKYFNDVRLENNNVHLASNRKKNMFHAIEKQILRSGIKSAIMAQ